MTLNPELFVGTPERCRPLFDRLEALFKEMDSAYAS